MASSPKNSRKSPENPVPAESEAELGSETLRNAQHEAFCQNYILHLNRYKAAIDAGYKDGTGLPTTVCHLLQREDVSTRVAYLQAHLADAAVIQRQHFVQELSNHCNADPRDIYDDDGNVKPLDEIPAPARRLITEFTKEVAPDGSSRVKIKLGTKAPYMQLLAKTLGFEAPTKVDHTSKGEKVPVVFVGVQNVPDLADSED